MCGQDEEHRQGVCPKDPEQVGDAKEGGDGMLPGGEGCSGVWRQKVDHKPPLRLSGHHQPCEYHRITVNINTTQSMSPSSSLPPKLFTSKKHCGLPLALSLKFNI